MEPGDLLGLRALRLSPPKTEHPTERGRIVALRAEGEAFLGDDGRWRIRIGESAGGWLAEWGEKGVKVVGCLRWGSEGVVCEGEWRVSWVRRRCCGGGGRRRWVGWG